MQASGCCAKAAPAAHSKPHHNGRLHHSEARIGGTRVGCSANLVFTSEIGFVVQGAVKEKLSSGEKNTLFKYMESPPGKEQEKKGKTKK